MMPLSKTLLIAAIATSMVLPATAMARQTDGKRTATSSKAAAKKSSAKRGYGFLPGYRQPPALTDWRAQNARYRAREQYEQRYWYYRPYSGYAQIRYGWGSPGIYRGRWNGGSFGPCWTYTPIGMVWNCGQ
jgi:hypothetical protein